MRIEICSRKRALQLAAEAEANTAVISVVSADEAEVQFDGFCAVGPVLHLSFNDLESEYDEEGIPYGRPLPKPADFRGLKAFADALSADCLLVHCFEGASRSAAIAAALYEYRGGTDVLCTRQTFRPNRLVYALACEALGIERGSLRYEAVMEEDGLRLRKKA